MNLEMAASIALINCWEDKGVRHGHGTSEDRKDIFPYPNACTIFYPALPTKPRFVLTSRQYELIFS